MNDPDYPPHLTVKCPKCGAVPDEECLERSQPGIGMRQVKPHKERLTALRKATAR